MTGWRCLVPRSLQAMLPSLAAACFAGAAGAQVLPANTAIPFYTPAHFMQGVHRDWYAPRAGEFAARAADLAGATAQLCSADAASAAPAQQQARERWLAAVTAWDSLSAVAVGPLVQRRSLRQIDFAPTRPELITRAIRAAPRDARGMERVGTPAKGLPALEWLLWTQPVAPATPACRYAVLVAQDIDGEAKALAQAFAELAVHDWNADEQAAVPAMSEFVNQWVGGLERLRWVQMEKPLRSAGGKPPAFPRGASGATLNSWAAQWQGLRSLGVAQGTTVAAPGDGLVPLETYLRGRGLNPLGGKLAAASAQVTRQLQALAPGDLGRPLAVTRSLASLKRLAETDMARALGINIGFSDADGD